MFHCFFRIHSLDNLAGSNLWSINILRIPKHALPGLLYRSGVPTSASTTAWPCPLCFTLTHAENYNLKNKVLQPNIFIFTHNNPFY